MRLGAGESLTLFKCPNKARPRPREAAAGGSNQHWTRPIVDTLRHRLTWRDQASFIPNRRAALPPRIATFCLSVSEVVVKT
jgi:hypothetical protein